MNKLFRKVDDIAKPHVENSVEGFKSVDIDDLSAQFTSKEKWGYWSNYKKIVVDGKEYAKIGDWFYTRHAVENMYPSGMGKMAGHTSNHPPVNISPKLVNEILDKNNIYTHRTYSKYHKTRAQHDLGDIRVITEENVVVTIMRKKRGK
jgi:hypothetical protein